MISPDRAGLTPCRIEGLNREVTAPPTVTSTASRISALPCSAATTTGRTSARVPVTAARVNCPAASANTSGTPGCPKNSASSEPSSLPTESVSGELASSCTTALPAAEPTAPAIGLPGSRSATKPATSWAAYSCVVVFPARPVTVPESPLPNAFQNPWVSRRVRTTDVTLASRTAWKAGSCSSRFTAAWICSAIGWGSGPTRFPAMPPAAAAIAPETAGLFIPSSSDTSA